MPDLRISTTRLEETGAALRLLAGELRDAERIVRDSRSAVGHRELAAQLDRMQGSWDDRRNDLRDAVEALAGVARDAGTAFERLEQELTKATGA